MAYRNTHGQKPRRTLSKRRARPTVAGWIVIGVGAVVFGKIVLILGGNLWLLVREAKWHHEEIALLRQETEWLREQNAALRRETQRLNTRSGIILEARKQGYGFPGERLLVIEPPPASPTTP
jgi:hypothetical protein